MQGSPQENVKVHCIVGGHGLGGVCDHFSRLNYRIKENLVWGAAMVTLCSLPDNNIYYRPDS